MMLLLFNAVSSVGGGIALMTELIPEQSQWVQHNDFPSLYVPGVILMAIVGGSVANVGMSGSEPPTLTCRIQAASAHRHNGASVDED
jgi:hypothetical protein